MYRLTSNWTNKITKVVVVQYSWHYNVEFGHRFSPALCRHSLMVRHCGRPYSSRLLTQLKSMGRHMFELISRGGEGSNQSLGAEAATDSD